MITALIHNNITEPIADAWSRHVRQRFMLAVSSANLALGFFAAFTQYWVLTFYFFSMSTYLYFQSRRVYQQATELEQAQRLHTQAQEALEQSQRTQAEFAQGQPKIEAIARSAEESSADTRRAVEELVGQLRSVDLNATLAALRAENDRKHRIVEQERAQLEALQADSPGIRDRNRVSARDRESSRQLLAELREEVKELEARAARARSQLDNNC